MLLLALNASNVDIKTGDHIRNKRQRLFQRITEGGHLTQDLDLLRNSARELLALVFSCRPGFNSSGLAARFAGDAIAADAHLPNMATEEFLPCLSKPRSNAPPPASAPSQVNAPKTPAPRSSNTRLIPPLFFPPPTSLPMETSSPPIKRRSPPMTAAEDETGSPAPSLNDSTEMEDEVPAGGEDFEDENRHLDADRHSSAYL